MGVGAMGAQAPGVPPAPRQEPVPERDRLAKQVEELRRAGRLDEAVAVAERALELERRAEEAMRGQVAEALVRLAELQEQRGNWDQAVVRRKEALAIRERMDGKEHWQTTDARLALAFAERAATLGPADRAKLGGALRNEQEAARLEEQGKYAEVERVALEALEIYRALIGPESAEVARVWHRIGRCRLAKNDARGAKQADELALAVFRKALPPGHPHIASSLNNLGGVQYALQDYASAKQRFEEALAIYRKALPPDHLDIAQSLNNLGGVQYALQDYASAKQRFEEALAIFRKSLPADHLDIAACLNNLGNVQHQLCDYAGAKRSYEEALAIRRKSLSPDHPAIAQSLTGLGAAQVQMRDYAGAKESNEQALAIFRKFLPQNHPRIADYLTAVGLGQRLLGDYVGAKRSYEEALAIQRKSLRQAHPNIARSLDNLGEVQRLSRDYAGAKRSYEEALAIFRKSLPRDQRQIATSLTGLGLVQHELRDYAGAKQSLEEALAIQRKALPPAHPSIATSLTGLGAVQRELRDYAGAKRSHEEALAISRKALPADHPDIAVSLNNLGIVQYELRDYAGAKRSHEEALEIRRKAKVQNYRDIAQSLGNLGSLQYEVRDYAGAKQSQKEALDIHRKVLPPDHPDIALGLNNLGIVQYELRDYRGANHSFQEALGIFRKALPADHPDIAVCLNNLGNVQYELRDYAGAKQSQKEALDIRRKVLPPDHPHIAFSLFNLGVMSLRSGVAVGDAVPGLAEATDLFQAEQLRMAVLQDEQEQLATAALARISLGNLLSATLITSAEPASAYDRVVRVKGSVTALQRWARQARVAADPDTTRLLDQLRQVTQRIVGLSMDNRPAQSKSDPRDVPDEIRTLSAKRDELERQLTERSAVYRTIQARAQVRSGEVRTALPEGSALIDLADYLHVEPPAKGQTEPSEERRMVAFVVRPERQEVVIIPLGPSQALAKWIDRWRASYGAGKTPPAGETDPGRELRKKVWEPLAKHLEGIKVVLVSPDGPLNGLPWAALPGSHPGTFLIHEYAFAVVPVPQLLPELLKGGSDRPADCASLVIGNIDFDAHHRAGEIKSVDQFSPLPGTEAEASAVHELFRAAFAGKPAELVTGKEATKAAFARQAPTCSYLLVATHGFFLPEPKREETRSPGRLRSLDVMLFHRDLVTSNPALRSGLVFAGANYATVGQGDAFLTALEASELDLARVDLAVLSACETGLGKVEGGEGVLGLQRAFQLAGARTAVTSLWKVSDAATRALMTRFHGNLWEKRMGKLEALHEAQIWLIQEGPAHPELLRAGLDYSEGKERDPRSPFYWAAFILSGDWR